VVDQSESSELLEAQKIQDEIDNRRLAKTEKNTKILPILLILPAIAGLAWVSYYFEQDLVPKIATESAASALDIENIVPLTIEQPRFNPEEVLEEKTPSPAAPTIKQSVWVDPKSSGKAWSEINQTAEGLLTFRGNPTRTFHGKGPLPEKPKTLWKTTIQCSISIVGEEEKEWCGTGWTGQPVIFKSPKNPDAWWLAVGGYNKSVNFYNPENGDEVFPKYETQDIIKGTVTIDPDGFPLLYTGSRDDFFHIVSLEGDEPELLWQLSSESDQATFWNNDWDGSAMIIDDYLFLGGENSRFYILKLNRSYEDGKVAVNPTEVFSTQAWDEELLGNLGDSEVSIENSVAISGNTIYFANSGGLVQGWDISQLKEGVEPKRVFRFWTGDDTDATVIIDKEGFLYVGSEYQRGTKRSDEVGQVMKLDPKKPDDPLVWGFKANKGLDTGIWATPALYENLLIVPTHTGELYGINRMTGEQEWLINFAGRLWSSPVIIDDKLLQADCRGNLHLFDLSEPNSQPSLIWKYTLAKGACIESTPAVWDGKIFVGARNGNFYGLN